MISLAQIGSSFCKKTINPGHFRPRDHPSLTRSLVTRTRHTSYTSNPTADINNKQALLLHSEGVILNAPQRILLYNSTIEELNGLTQQPLQELTKFASKDPRYESPTYIVPSEAFLKTRLGQDLEENFELIGLKCFVRTSNLVTTAHPDSPNTIHMAINLSQTRYNLYFKSEQGTPYSINGLNPCEGVLFPGGYEEHHVKASRDETKRLFLYFQKTHDQTFPYFDPSNFSSGVFEQRLQEKGDLLTTFLSYPSLFARIQLTAETRDNLKHALDSESCSYESRKAIAFAEHTPSVPSILVNPYSALGKSSLIADAPILTWMRRPRHCHPIPSHYDQKGLISFIYNLEDGESIFLNLDGRRLEILPYEGIAFHASTYHGLDLNPKSKSLGHRLIGYTPLKRFIELPKHTLENFTCPWMALQLYEL